MPCQPLAIQRVLHQRIQQRLARDVFGERAVLAPLARLGHVPAERRRQRLELRRRGRRRGENRMIVQHVRDIQRQVADVIVRCFGESGIDAKTSYRRVAC